MSVVISVENVSKLYRLGTISSGTLSHDLNRAWARLRGKPDPLLKIGQEDHSNREGEYIWALRDVSFEVKEGEVLGIIGRNGAGKSTLLKILSRVTAPTSGQIKVKGRVASLLDVGTGFHPELTGRENVFLNGAILGMSRAEIQRKFEEIVAFAEVEQFIDTPVKRYSSGMYVRLAFAVAAHLEPEILVVDEVLAVGDVGFQKKCLGKMDEVSKGGRTVLFVTHNMGMIRSLCECSMLLVDGKMAAEGSSHDVVSTYLSLWNVENETKGEVCWTEAEKAPGCDEMRLRSVRVLGPTGQIQDIVEVDKPILVEITYELYSRLRGMRIQLSLTTEEGVIAFVSTDQDQRPNTSQPGRYRSLATIPPGLLNRKKYFVGLAFDMPGVSVLMDTQDFLSLTVVTGAIEGSSYIPPTWGGVLAPSLEWSIEKLN